MNTAMMENYMKLALRQAEQAYEDGETPTGCIIIRSIKEGDTVKHSLVGKTHNQVEKLKDPTAHAEILAITQAASAVGDWRLTDCTLFVTKEPCAMCAGAIILARIPTVVFGVKDTKRGGESVFKILDNKHLNHRCKVHEGVLEEECKILLQEFFREKRKSAGSVGSD